MVGRLPSVVFVGYKPPTGRGWEGEVGGDGGESPGDLIEVGDDNVLPCGWVGHVMAVSVCLSGCGLVAMQTSFRASK